MYNLNMNEKKLTSFQTQFFEIIEEGDYVLCASKNQITRLKLLERRLTKSFSQLKWQKYQKLKK